MSTEESTPEIRIHVRFEPSDYVLARMYWLLRNTWWALVFISLLGIVSAYLWHADPVGLYYMIAPTLVFGIFTPLMLYGNYSTALRDCPKGEKADVGFLLSDSQFSVSTLHGHSELNWSAFVRVVETQRMFFFVTENKATIVLPKRVLDTSSEIRLRSILKSQLPERGIEPRSWLGSLL